MPDDPYRSPPTVSEADAEVARLAAEGERRAHEERLRKARAQDAEKEHAVLARVREALASSKQFSDRSDEEDPGDAVAVDRATRGLRWASNVAFVLAGVGILPFVFQLPQPRDHYAFGLEQSVGPFVVFGSFLLAMAALGGASLLRSSAQRKASGLSAEAVRRRREAYDPVSAAKAWVARLPFAMEGFLDVLAQEPEVKCRLEVELTWDDSRGEPDGGTLQGIVGLVDADARVVSNNGPAVTIASGEISNDAVAEYLLALVEKVLIPLHRSHALVHVSIRRGR
jgi:hypothetical protein